MFMAFFRATDLEKRATAIARMLAALTDLVSPLQVRRRLVIALRSQAAKQRQWRTLRAGFLVAPAAD
jgi:hypothetical protein